MDNSGEFKKVNIEIPESTNGSLEYLCKELNVKTVGECIQSLILYYLSIEKVGKESEEQNNGTDVQ